MIVPLRTAANPGAGGGLPDGRQIRITRRIPHPVRQRNWQDSHLRIRFGVLPVGSARGQQVFDLCKALRALACLDR